MIADLRRLRDEIDGVLARLGELAPAVAVWQQASQGAQEPLERVEGPLGTPAAL
jgi:hypothetical protein